VRGSEGVTVVAVTVVVGVGGNASWHSIFLSSLLRPTAETIPFPPYLCSLHPLGRHSAPSYT
jgi:hypothetical protein